MLLRILFIGSRMCPCTVVQGDHGKLFLHLLILASWLSVLYSGLPEAIPGLPVTHSRVYSHSYGHAPSLPIATDDNPDLWLCRNSLIFSHYLMQACNVDKINLCENECLKTENHLHSLLSYYWLHIGSWYCTSYFFSISSVLILTWEIRLLK